ncbi:MAG: response regulator [Chromatiaceae bacterium]|nr:response regulator [Candidatus Thioaporhodococcus sediminis]
MSFRLKTILGIALIEAILLAVLIVSGLRWLQESNQAQLLQRAETSVHLFTAMTKDAVLTLDLATLESFVQEVLTNPGISYARVRDSQGRVLAQGGDGAALARDFRPDTDPALARDGVFDTFALIEEAGVSFGRVEIGLEVAAFRALLEEARLKASAIALLEMGLVALFSLLLGTYLTRQLGQLRRAAGRVVEEGPGFQLPVAGNDDLAQTLIAFNDMSARLALARAEQARVLEELRHQIAQRETAEEELRLTAQAFETQEAIFITDTQGVILRVNRAFTAITGYTADEALGQTPAILKSGRQDEAFYHGLWAQLLNAGHWQGEIENRRKGGDIYPEWLSISAVRDPEGRITHFVAHFIDITERKRTERALEEALQRAELASEAKSRFLATMSHEIRTPLNAIINSNDLLQETELNPEQAGYVAMACEAGRSLLSIINSVLDFSKIEAGRVELRPERCDPAEITAMVARMLLSRATTKGIKLDLFTDAHLGQGFTTDPGLLRQILLNLVANAIKFTERGGVRIQILYEEPRLGEMASAGRVPQPGETMARGGDRMAQAGHRMARPGGEPGEPGAGWLRFEVIDTGIGIPAERMDELFKEFSQLDSSDRRRFGGTGLGLAISRSLARLLGGDIGCDSQPGKGSRFWLRLPAGAVEVFPLPPDSLADGLAMRQIPLQATPPLPAKSPSFRPFQRGIGGPAVPAGQSVQPILLVDDSQANRLVAEAILAKAGFRTESARNGREALAAVQRQSYGLVLMDVAMPEMDGIEATQAIRALSGDRGRIPIVAMTAAAFVEDKQRCLDAGMNDYLSKPLVRAELLGVVERWLPLAAPPPAATGGDAWTEIPALPLGGYRTLGDGLLDEAALSKLAVDVGPDFLPSLVTSFTREMERRLLRVAEAKNRGDLAALALEAHAIKGSAGTFGAPALSAEALILERAAKSGETDQAWGKVPDLMAVAAETLSRLRDRFAGELDQGPA